MNWTRLATAALFVAAVPALAQNVPVRILRPAPEQTVRGNVPIAINTNAIPDSGYMMVEVNDEFLSAIAPETDSATTQFLWDTREDFPETDAPPRDGQYTVRVKTYNGQFQFQRSNELNVYLRNHISVPPTRTFRLQYKFRPDQEIRRVETVRARSAGVEVYSASVPVTLAINDVTGGVAEAREQIERDAAERIAGTRQPLNVAGRSFIVRLLPTGRVEPGRRMQRAGLSPVASMLTFPTTPLRVGDSWSSEITIHPYYNGVHAATISANNTLVGFEYFNGRPSARIESTYDGAATVGAGVQGGATPGGMPSATPTSSVTFRGKRTTYFDHVNGRLLRAEDELTANFGAGGATGSPSPYGPGAGGTTPAVNLNIVTVAR